MDSSTHTDQSDAVAVSDADLKLIGDQSQPFIGHWHRLNSTTNWEKGQIIHQWRTALIESGAAPRLYSDPAWSRLVGEVSAQHVGRLRRTFARFGSTQSQYEGLYWSHFFAALDWHDAEMWLEGAVQNRWSVSKMRYERWQATGAATAERPNVSDIVVSPEDEGLAVLQTLGVLPDREASAIEVVRDAADVVHMDQTLGTTGPRIEGPDFGDESSESPAPRSEPSTGKSKVDVEQVLDELPPTIANPYREFRQAVLECRETGWQTATRLQIITLINDLKQIMRRASAAETESKDGLPTR